MITRIDRPLFIVLWIGEIHLSLSDNNNNNLIYIAPACRMTSEPGICFGDDGGDDVLFSVRLSVVSQLLQSAAAVQLILCR